MKVPSRLVAAVVKFATVAAALTLLLYVAGLAGGSQRERPASVSQTVEDLREVSRELVNLAPPAPADPLVVARELAPAFDAPFTEAAPVPYYDEDEELFGEYATLSGVVWDPSGYPLEGATVACDAPFGISRTDVDGNYELRLRRDVDDYTVVASHPQHGIDRLRLDMRPDVIASFLDFELPTGATAQLFVTDEGGLPVADAEVRMWRSDDRSSPGVLLAEGEQREWLTQQALLNGAQVRTARTSSDGVALLHGLREGTYRLSVRALGLVSAARSGIAVDPNAFADLGEVRLHAGQRLTGRVLDCAGSPMPEMRVRGLFDFEYFEAESDAQGRFELSGISGDVDVGEVLVQGASGELFWDAAVLLSTDDILEIRLCSPTLALEVRSLVTGLGVDAPATVSLLGLPGGGALLPTVASSRRDVVLRAGRATLEGVPSNVSAIVCEVSGFYPGETELAPGRERTTLLVPLEESAGLQLRGGQDGSADAPAPRTFTLAVKSESGFRQRAVTARPGDAGELVIDAMHFPVSAGASLLGPADPQTGEPRVLFTKTPGARLPSEPVELDRY